MSAIKKCTLSQAKLFHQDESLNRKQFENHNTLEIGTSADYCPI